VLVLCGGFDSEEGPFGFVESADEGDELVKFGGGQLGELELAGVVALGDDGSEGEAQHGQVVPLVSAHLPDEFRVRDGRCIGAVGPVLRIDLARRWSRRRGRAVWAMLLGRRGLMAGGVVGWGRFPRRLDPWGRRCAAPVRLGGFWSGIVVG